MPEVLYKNARAFLYHQLKVAENSSLFRRFSSLCRSCYPIYKQGEGERSGVRKKIEHCEKRK